ncbi:hypothetical protein IV102_25390 [bacterium]|nr:hypothetical protein [bacterium]
MEIPAAGSARSASNPSPAARAKSGDQAAQSTPTDSSTAAGTTSALQQSVAASNPSAAAALTQQQADTAQVILKGPPHPGPQ